MKNRDEKNFVKKNLLKVVLEPTQAAAKVHVEEKQEPFSHKNQGKIPSYINKYNKQREDALRQKYLDEENSKLPPGTRLMQEDERRATLDDLTSAKKMTND